MFHCKSSCDLVESVGTNFTLQLSMADWCCLSEKDVNYSDFSQYEDHVLDNWLNEVDELL